MTNGFANVGRIVILFLWWYLMLKLYYYTRHEWLGASSRYRSIQYFELLNSNGVSVVHRALFSDEYLKRKYKRNFMFMFTALNCYFLRLLNLFVDLRPGNVIVLEKEFFPYFPAVFEWLANKVGVKVVVDFDDAVWHNYDKHRSIFVRAILSNKHRSVISNASGVICGNNYLYQYAKNCNQNNVVIIPSVVPKGKYIIKKKQRSLFTVVWIGSPSTSHQVISIRDQLKAFTDIRNAEIKLIGFDESLKYQVNFKARFIKWDSQTEVDELCDSDVGIMPLIDGSFERGKCGFKLVQYMGVGKPCIASNVGCNSEIVAHLESGFIVDEPNDWLRYLLYLHDSPSQCQIAGARGREIFEDRYTVESQLENYLSFIFKTVGVAK